MLSTDGDPGPLQFSDANDADQFDDTRPMPDQGRVPDHTATAGDDSPADAETPGEKRWPWEKAGRKATGGGSPSASRRTREKKSDTDPDAPVPALPRNFESDLADVYRTLGAFLSPIDPVCGQQIRDAAPDCASKLVALARSNADVRRVLLKFVGTSAVGAVIAAHAPILMAVVGHHVMPIVMRQNGNPTTNGSGSPVPGDNQPFPEPGTGNVRPFVPPGTATQ